MVTVEFRDVGRRKRTWTAELPDLFYDTLYAETKMKGRLMSSDLSFTMREDGKTGFISAGLHPVGTFTIVREESAVALS